MLIFAWKVPLVSLVFLKRSLVFPILLFSFISLHWSLRKFFLSLFAIPWNSAFKWVYLSFSPLLFTSLPFSVICKASSDNHFAFLHFFFLGMISRHSWVSLVQSLVGSLLLSPGSWCTHGALPESVSESCVSSGSSMVVLMATSSKRAYAIPRSAVPRAPAPAAGHCWTCLWMECNC